ncbi:hypothetical protein [Aquabacterium sp.]|uniref:COG4648 family protein n=1 Tax=Aquabacterium sp. TaxID=1872578 RepID=UPI0024877B46|nr:hypothetical protein [Aquabacterium sp.]MDI1258450.1 hypothetical protein [Aquabacterium sp.]
MKSSSPAAPPVWLAVLGFLGALSLLAAYLVACHVATLQRSPWAPYLYFLPLMGMLFSAVAGRWGSAWGGGLTVAVVVGLCWLLPRWQGDLNLLYVLQHVGTNLAFCWVFGHTLASGREPLVTRFARIMRRGDMPPEVMSFTRAVTLAWALFFAGIALASAFLYAAVSLEAWSVFSNLLNSPLIGLMFVVEYAVRRYKLRNIRHSSILDSVQAFRKGWPVAEPNPTTHDSR